MEQSGEIAAVLGLHTLHIGSKTLFELRERFGTYDQAYTAFLAGKDLQLSESQLAGLRERQRLLPRIQELVEQYSIQIIAYDDPAYPRLLREIADPPAVLYVRGLLPEAPRVAIVGSRKCTSYGLRAATDLARAAAGYGITVVSGLALGIDGAAHRAASDQSGPTVGVLACGVEQIYPASHRGLAQQMLARGGAVLSEFPLLTPPFRGNFLVRNRIIAGLASLTVVVESGLESGALVTARLALDYNRDVWAVPGDIYRDMAAGPNALLRMGAAPVTSGDALADYFAIVPTAQKQAVDLSPQEQTIVSSISREGTHIDVISEALPLDIAATSSTLVLLEIKGIVKHEGAGVYRRIV